MPARIASTRSSRPTSSSGRKASATLTSTRTVSVAAPPFTFADADENTLRPKVCAIFRDAQRNVATHRKLVVNLRKIHETCCYETAGQTTEASHEFDEETFNKEFIRCVLRVMPVKKTESVGEKTVKFIGFFLRHASDKDYELVGEVEGDMVPETPTSRLITQLLEAVIPLMSVKDKFVRYRSTQLLSQIVNSLDALDDELYHNLRQSLLRRVRDKEAMVRVQAVLGLGRLAGNQSDGASNSENDDDKDGSGLLEKLLQVLQNDPSADVRRSLLVNLPILPNTLPFLLERARDQDAATRRAVYARLLPALGDFRHLSLSMREKLLRWGMRDRDENVRKAAGKLFRERWIEDCAGTVNPEESVPNFDGLLELLERIDVINSGVENGVALEAMNGFWEGRGDYRDAVNFDDEFWETLSAEAAFLARSLNDFCRAEGNRKYESLIEEKMPEVTRLAFYLERYLNALIDTSKRVQANELEEDEEDLTVEQEFIVEQLLHIALSLDYSDEVGRRKMFTLLRQSLSIPELPDQVTKLTIEVLYYICSPDAAGEREFCSIVLESVADVHDTIVDDPTDDVEDSFHSARSEVSGLSTPTKGGRKAMNAEDARERAVKEIVINMKCLHIVQCMLTHIVGHLKDNADLVSMLNNLVVPAVRSHEAPVRERGLVCLGLCALQDRSLAEENLGLFIHFFNKGHAALQITALQILTDILNVHGAHLFSSTPALLKVYVKAVKSSSKSSDVQAAAIMATSKLLLGRVVTDEEACQELLKSLVIAYFDPLSASNQTVRQALNYFLPVFCYSRSSNQDLMRSISLVVLHSLLNLRDGLEDDDEADVDEDMMGMATIGACLVDWTDPRKCYGATNLLEPEKKHVNGDVHLDFALDILDRLHTNISKEEKKLIAGLFSKLYVSPESSQDKLREAYEDISVAVDDGLCADATSRNSLYKIHVSLGKIVNALDEQQPVRDQRTASGIQAAGPGSEGKTGSVEASIKDEDDLDGDSNGTVIARYDRSSTIGEMSATAVSAVGQDTEMGDDSI